MRRRLQELYRDFVHGTMKIPYLDLQSTDCILNSFPRSGNTWMRFMIFYALYPDRDWDLPQIMDLMNRQVDEVNPQLGWRGIRVSLDLKELFRSQIRALLRASQTGNLSILLPMISTLEEVREAKRIIAETREELRIEGHDVTAPYRLGVMIETPAAVHLAPHLAKEADFFSIGTNDLIQYGLAVDRDNVKVAYLFDPFHPAISAMVRRVVEVGRDAGIPVSICGEMAGEPLGAVLLVGLGARILSVHPYLIPDLKRIFCLMDTREAAELADRVIGLPSATEAREAVESFVHELELRSQETKQCEGG